eukprot:scaffold32638_cov112-Isochrysis_galbana.AAC.2
MDGKKPPWRTRRLTGSSARRPSFQRAWGTSVTVSTAHSAMPARARSDLAPPGDEMECPTSRTRAPRAVSIALLATGMDDAVIPCRCSDSSRAVG